MDEKNFPDSTSEAFYPRKTLEIPEEPDEPVENPLSPEEMALIEDSVAFINQTVAVVVNAAVSIGEHLLTRYFNDDIALATSKNPYKQISYKQLCDRPDLMLTRRELGAMIRVAAQERFFRAIEINTQPLSYTHKKYLTLLPDNETKADLTAECIENQLSSRQLYLKVKEVKSRMEPEGPSPIEQLFTGHIRRIARAIRQAGMPDLFGDLEAVSSLTRESRVMLRDAASRWTDELENIRFQYIDLVRKLEQMDSEPC